MFDKKLTDAVESFAAVIIATADSIVDRTNLISALLKLSYSYPAAALIF